MNEEKDNSLKSSSEKFRAKIDHNAAVLWFTGLSGSGKSTLSQSLEKRLQSLGLRTMILDGDNLRGGLCSDLGFSLEDRSENIRRAGEVAKLFVSADVLTLAAFISPLQKDRSFVRGIFGDKKYFEIYCKCPLDVCERRDIKGIYKRARAGKISNFTGIDSAYEIPVNPDLIIDTANQNIDKAVDVILEFLKEKEIIF